MINSFYQEVNCKKKAVRSLTYGLILLAIETYNELNGVGEEKLEEELMVESLLQSVLLFMLRLHVAIALPMKTL